jgi:hypothetical protein
MAKIRIGSWRIFYETTKQIMFLTAADHRKDAR